MAGKCFGADVGKLFERLLAAPRGSPDSLTETYQRIDDEWRADQTEERQPRVVVKEDRRKADDRERFAREVADCLRYDLWTGDVLVIRRWCRCSLREERPDWSRYGVESEFADP